MVLVARAREVMGRYGLSHRLASLTDLADRLEHAELARQAFGVIGEMPPDGLLLCHFVEQLGAGPGRG